MPYKDLRSLRAKASKAMRKQRCAAKARARGLHSLADGETHNPRWCQDVLIDCTCEPVNFFTMDVVAAARGIARHVLAMSAPIPGVWSIDCLGDFVMYDRCLGCGVTCLARDYRWQESRRVIVDLSTVVPNKLRHAQSDVTRIGLMILNGATPSEARKAVVGHRQSISYFVRELKRAGICATPETNP